MKKVIFILVLCILGGFLSSCVSSSSQQAVNNPQNNYRKINTNSVELGTREFFSSRRNIVSMVINTNNTLEKYENILGILNTKKYVKNILFIRTQRLPEESVKECRERLSFVCKAHLDMVDIPFENKGKLAPKDFWYDKENDSFSCVIYRKNIERGK